MMRLGGVRGLLVLAACWLSVSAAEAQAAERVSIFVVEEGVSLSASAKALVADVRAELVRENKLEVAPTLRAAGSLKEPVLEDVRELGRSAFAALAGGRDATELLREYEPAIIAVLDRVSAVRSVEARTLLWNLCALRVRLLLSDQDDTRATEAALGCARRFVEGPRVGRVWLPEVEQVFERANRDQRRVPLSIKSVPADCEVSIYGAVVGITPLVVDVVAGSQEVQLTCQGRHTALHRLEALQRRDLVILAEADASWVEEQGISYLRYPGPQPPGVVLDAAVTLAAEADVDSFVLVSTSGDRATVQWLQVPDRLLGEATFSLSDPQRGTVARVFRGVDGADDMGKRSEGGRAHLWQDYVLGSALSVSGGVLTAIAATTMARDGLCADADCRTVYAGHGWLSRLELTAGALLVAGGVAVMWIGPFARRRQVAAGIGASGFVLKGRF